MIYFVTGVNGQLGFDVARELIDRGYEVIGCGRSPVYRGIEDAALSSMQYVQLDIREPEAVWEALNADNKVSLYTNVGGEVKLFNKHLED